MHFPARGSAPVRTARTSTGKVAVAAAVAGGVAVGLRGLLTGLGSAPSSGADRRARHGAQLRRHSPRGGGGRLQLFDQRDVFGGVLVARRARVAAGGGGLL